jgi:hypothetical protein
MNEGRGGGTPAATLRLNGPYRRTASASATAREDYTMSSRMSGSPAGPVSGTASWVLVRRSLAGSGSDLLPHDRDSAFSLGLD